MLKNIAWQETSLTGRSAKSCSIAEHKSQKFQNITFPENLIKEDDDKKRDIQIDCLYNKREEEVKTNASTFRSTNKAKCFSDKDDITCIRITPFTSAKKYLEQGSNHGLEGCIANNSDHYDVQHAQKVEFDEPNLEVCKTKDTHISNGKTTTSHHQCFSNRNAPKSTIAETISRKTIVVQVMRPNSCLIRLPDTSNTMGSRATLKMQLQRDMVIQEDKRFLKNHLSNNSGSDGRSSNTSAINFPSRHISKPELPAQIFKVETSLQNPTQYHVKATQLNQVREFLSHSQDGTKYVTGQLLAARSSAPSGGKMEAFRSSTPASPLARLNLSTSVDNLTGEFGDDNIIDDIVSLESSFNEDPTRYQTVSATLPTVSPLELDRFAQNASNNLPVVIQETTSSSCPVIKPIIKREIPDDMRHFEKDRIKKDNHNIIERRRRYNINDRIKELGMLVPKSVDHQDTRWNKGSILKAAVDYICLLQKEQAQYGQLEQRNKQMTAVNKKLLLRVQELEITLQHHGINVTSDSAEKESMVDLLFDNYKVSPTKSESTIFTREEERQVKNFPTHPISPPDASPSIIVTQQQGLVQSGTPTSTNMMGQDVYQQFQPQQIISADNGTLGMQQQHFSPNPPFNQFSYSPLGSAHSSTTSPQPATNIAQQSTQTSSIDLGLSDIDMSNFAFDNTGNADANMEDRFNAFQHSQNENYNDVIMEDGFALIKDDIFLSDATNPSSLGFQ